MRVETVRLVLDPLDDEDAVALNAIRNDEEARRYLGPRPFEALADTRELIHTINVENAAGRALSLAVRRRPDLALIGFVGAWRVDVAGEAELGYLIARSCWNRGYATEALPALLEAFDCHFGALTLSAVVHEHNRWSIRLLQRLGFEAVPATGKEDADFVRYRRLA